ncbi:MAG: hypothetical protein HQL80_05565 [Magnetococcales bacterium]|nr:hypothetical protein [Magnetococcales bacterium]MBF0583689.1 hypothetical protein [Magnetococcales bacterium]
MPRQQGLMVQQQAAHQPPAQAPNITTVSVGPIPDPNALGLYGQIDPSFPGRIVSVMERQETHRQELEKFNLEQSHAHNASLVELEKDRLLLEKERLQSDNARYRRGQQFGLVAVLAGYVLAGVMAFLGHEIFASVIGGVSSASLVTAFITERVFDNKKDRTTTESSMTKPEG